MNWMSSFEKVAAPKTILKKQLLQRSNCWAELVTLMKWLLWKSAYCEEVVSPKM